MTKTDWFKLEEGEGLTHWCGGVSEDKATQKKPPGTQVAMTFWFSPSTYDEETKVSKCRACGEERKHDDTRTIIVGE